ncbi:hypothetical protein BUE76_12520 [Cnuella takakiae]|nr:hypothetical protein BUE76_12520 [Cnuella takakiae]
MPVLAGRNEKPTREWDHTEQLANTEDHGSSYIDHGLWQCKSLFPLEAQAACFRMVVQYR